MGARVSRLLGYDLLDQGGLMLPTISGTPNLPRTPSWKSSWPLGAPGKVDFSIAFFLQAFHLLAPLYPSLQIYPQPNPLCQGPESLSWRAGGFNSSMPDTCASSPERACRSERWGKTSPFSCPPYRTQLSLQG